VALKDDPNYLPALIYAARVLNTGGNNQAFDAVMQDVHKNLDQAATLDFDERLELAIALVLSKDMVSARDQIIILMKTATTSELRRLTPEQLYNLSSFLRQVGLIDTRPGLAGFIDTLLPDFQRVQLLLEMAKASQHAGHLPEALTQLRRAHDRAPGSLPALVELARFLATAPDASLRNGREAVVLALQAHEFDHGQDADTLDVLACAYAETGQFALAETVEKLAVNSAEAAHAGLDAANYQTRLTAFHNKQPFHALQ
jgi:hypothetical protein